MKKTLIALLMTSAVVGGQSWADAGHSHASTPASSASETATTAAQGGHGHDAAAHSDSEQSGSHWMAPEAFQSMENPVAKTADSIQQGKALFAEHCASCHGAFGEGDGPAAAQLTPKPANLREMADQHPDGDFFWKIAQGRGAMPAWKGVLTEEQI